MKYYTIIASRGCVYCDMSRDLLYDNGEEFIQVKYLENEPAIRGLMNLAGLTTVPQIFTDKGEHVGGYEQLQEHVKKSG